uniref:ORF81b n=1 Tax=Pinus koraiensis TaxID=88728 RepID=A4QM56_PINKO|nr:ORF81b [Pinus koraiensis]ABP35393.1 ORF81b [Pinus koraiensis]
MPLLRMVRNAVSLPRPGPLIITSTRPIPRSINVRITFSAAVWAANGVPLLVPLNPQAPAEDQEITCPRTSVAVTMVLLKLA